MMKLARSTILTLAIFVASACGKNPVEPVYPKIFGFWARAYNSGLPPVSLEIRLEQSGYVGQVWLSGVTYTLPAAFGDSSVILANPASSALAPFSAVLTSNGELRATLRSPNQADVVVQLFRVLPD